MKSQFETNKEEVEAMQYFYSKLSQRECLNDLIKCARKYHRDGTVDKFYQYKNAELLHCKKQRA